MNVVVLFFLALNKIDGIFFFFRKMPKNNWKGVTGHKTGGI